MIRQTSITEGLVGWWPFDKGVANNCTAYPLGAATVVGAVPSPGLGTIPNSNSFKFNGTSNYIEVGDSTLLRLATALTAACWVNGNSQSLANGLGIIRKDTLTGTRYLWGLQWGAVTNNKVYAEYFNGSIFRAASNLALNGAWHHVAMTIGGTLMTLYVDGLPNSQATITGTQGVPTGAMDFGADPQNSGGARAQFFSGSARDYRVYNRPLRPQEIMNLYLEGVNGPVTLSPRLFSSAQSVISKAVTVSSSTSSAFVKSARKTLAVTSASVAVSARSIAKPILATCSSLAAIAKASAKGIAVTCASAATMARQTAKGVATTVSGAVVLATQRAILAAIIVAVSSTSGLVKAASKLISVTSVTATASSRAVSKLISAAVSTAMTILKSPVKLLAVSSATATSIASMVAKSLAVLSSSSSVVQKTAAKLFGVAASTAVSVISGRAFILAVSVAVSSASGVKKTVGKIAAATSSTATALSKLCGKAVTVVAQSFAAFAYEAVINLVFPIEEGFYAIVGAIARLVGVDRVERSASLDAVTRTAMADAIERSASVDAADRQDTIDHINRT